MCCVGGTYGRNNSQANLLGSAKTSSLIISVSLMTCLSLCAVLRNNLTFKGHTILMCVSMWFDGTLCNLFIPDPLYIGDTAVVVYCI